MSRSALPVTSLDPSKAPDEYGAAEASIAEFAEVLALLDTTSAGLTSAEASRRLAEYGPNAVRSHRVSAAAVLARQLKSAILALLAVTAVISFFLGDRNDAVIIGIILTASIGLGFTNEYRAERASAALHSQVRHTALTLRDGSATEVDVADLIPGDILRLTLGSVVPADLRLIAVNGLECDESMLSGESLPAPKSLSPLPPGSAQADLVNCAFMGTVVRAGTADGVVIATGNHAEFGRIAAALGQKHPETDFQIGLRKFSMLLLKVALALVSMILIINLVLERPVIESLLFALAIAVGITPQLLPAVVSSSLASGSRQLAKHKVLVKRLVCIEDLGDLDVLVTDKTGTLTNGQITFTHALTPDGLADDRVLLYGLLSTESRPEHAAQIGPGANPMDAALWQASDSERGLVAGFTTLGIRPFDHERRMTSALVRGPSASSPELVVKGAPEVLLDRCLDVSAAAHRTLTALFADGSRVVAVAAKSAPGLTQITPEDETALTLVGFLVFLDEPKAAAKASLKELNALGIAVKVATGDNAQVSEKVCRDLGLASGGTLLGAEIDAMDDQSLTENAQLATIFARVSPEQKARVIRLLRRRGRAVGFLGDGVNDALALHAADVGISVDTATDVAKDAADVLLLEKDLGVLATGVSEGRRIFANTIKYVRMGTSSNFGNMFSAAAASAVLPFLPMLPSQILLNNLLYDSSQLTIPTDHVDAEQLQAPSHWNIAFIRKFMLTFGPISSLFDFMTFAVMLGIFHAGPELFRTGWFVESLATQTLIIFAIRTRRTPFFRSRPSAALVISTAAVMAIGVALTVSPWADDLGFTALPLDFFVALVLMVAVYLVFVEFAKKMFYSEPVHPTSHERVRGTMHRIHRRASRFSTPLPLPSAQ
ncbi:magnesium-translocating P-type ATPase [Rhodococcus erythropolis]|uniref:magnesium-translocating P-type ATPase n=1 Tax=Rhodococcus erythropolis TaxID=1833 RepID=UPI0038233F3D